jgi:hypothetical protein
MTQNDFDANHYAAGVRDAVDDAELSDDCDEKYMTGYFADVYQS